MLEIEEFLFTPLFFFTLGTVLDLSLGGGGGGNLSYFTLLALLVPHDCTKKNFILF